MRIQIKDFEDYTIDEFGEILNSKTGRKVKHQVNKDGYFVVNLYRNGKSFHRRINRLVAEAFIENPNNLPVVNHIDHNRQNNSITNLEWCTEKHNTLESVRLFPEKRKHLAVISKDDAIKVCELIQEGYRNKEIVEKLNLSTDLIKHIRSGKTWKEVSCNYDLKRSKRSISENTVRWVCYRIKEGYQNKQILSMSTCKNLNIQMIKRIKYKKNWLSISSEILT